MISKGDKALYKNNNGTVCSQDILESLGFLKEGDTALVHSDIVPFGTLATSEREWFFDSLTACFMKSVGLSGNLLMPVFTYSFCRNEVFDVQNSPSTVGAFTEAFRKRKGVSRSLHPIFSFAGTGASADKLLTADNDSFGDGSVFANLLKADAWLVFFGTGLHSATFIHHVEQKHSVPYRYMKRFEGSVINMGVKYETYADYYVRDLELNPILNIGGLEKKIMDEGALKVFKLGDGLIKAVKAADFYNIGLDMLNKDIYSFVSFVKP